MSLLSSKSEWGTKLEEKRKSISEIEKIKRRTIENLFKNWQKEEQNIQNIETLSDNFWQAQKKKKKKVTNSLTSLEGAFLNFTEISISKTDWQNYAQNSNTVQRQSAKYPPPPTRQ